MYEIRKITLIKLYKKIKSVKTLKVKHEVLFIASSKAIKNIIRFFYLFIFLNLSYLAHTLSYSFNLLY